MCMFARSRTYYIKNNPGDHIRIREGEREWRKPWEIETAFPQRILCRQPVLPLAHMPWLKIKLNTQYQRFRGGTGGKYGKERNEMDYPCSFHTHTNTYTNTLPVCIHVCTHTYTETHMHTSHTCLHTHTYTHVHICVHMFTHAYICTRTFSSPILGYWTVMCPLFFSSKCIWLW